MQSRRSFDCKSVASTTKVWVHRCTGIRSSIQLILLNNFHDLRPMVSCHSEHSKRQSQNLHWNVVSEQCRYFKRLICIRLKALQFYLKKNIHNSVTETISKCVYIKQSSSIWCQFYEFIISDRYVLRLFSRIKFNTKRHQNEK